MVVTKFLHEQNLSKEDFIKVKIGKTAYKKVVASSVNERDCEVILSFCYSVIIGLGKGLEKIINLERLNDIRYLNKYFEAVNRTLKYGGIFKGNVEIYAVRRNRILKNFPHHLIEYTYF
jgi:hypothetical protein